MTTYSKGVVVLYGHTFVGSRDQSGSYSPPAVAIAPAKTVSPLPPTLTDLTGVPNAPGTLQLSLELPSTNTDGSILAISEIVRLRVHFSTSQGVSTSDPYNDFPPAEVVTWAPNMSGRVYVKARVQDSHGNWSQLSNELYDDVPEVEPFEFWAHRINETAIFSNNTPSSGYVSWSGVTIYFQNLGYAVANGSTNQRYIFWKLSNPGVFETSNTVPSLGIDDVLIGTNVGGSWYIAIYHPQVSAEFIRVGKLQSTNWGASTGSELDLDTGTFKLGGSSSPKLSWDGSALSIIGSIVVTGGQVPYTFVSGGPPANADNTSTVITGGLITTGRIELGASGSVKAGIDGAGTADSDIRFWAGTTYANRTTAPFRVTQGGALVATSANISGSISASTITGSTIRTADSGWRVELSSTGSYPLQYWNGTTRRFYVDTAGNVYITGQVISASGSQISGSHLSGGTITGIPIYGAGAYPYSHVAASSLLAYQSASYYGRLTPSALTITGAQDTVELTQTMLNFYWGPASIVSGSGLTLSALGGYYLTLTAATGAIVCNSPSFVPTGAASANLGTASQYFNQVNYKELIDRGCLGWFEDGVRLRDGRMVSDIQALKEIRPHPELQTTYGVPRLDYSTMPEPVFRPAPIVNGKKEGEDGACLDALVSIMLGAIKELDRRLTSLEEKIGGAP